MHKHKSKRHLRRVSVELIPLDNPAYEMMVKIRKRHHEHIRKAKIALVWKKKIKADRDGHVLLGKCHKMGDTLRELSEFDFIILLNKEVWEAEEFGHKRQKALLDHELCHAAPVIERGHTHKQQKNERGKYVFRMRHHDVEEFSEIVDRHGIWKHDLQTFADALFKRRHRK